MNVSFLPKTLDCQNDSEKGHLSVLQYIISQMFCDTDKCTISESFWQSEVLGNTK